MLLRVRTISLNIYKQKVRNGNYQQGQAPKHILSSSDFASRSDYFYPVVWSLPSLLKSHSKEMLGKLESRTVSYPVQFSHSKEREINSKNNMYDAWLSIFRLKSCGFKYTWLGKILHGKIRGDIPQNCLMGIQITCKIQWTKKTKQQTFLTAWRTILKWVWVPF